jgi:hypothetical protein
MSVIVVLHNVVFYMIGSWLTLATSYMPNDGQWRVPFALQVCFFNTRNLRVGQKADTTLSYSLLAS